MRTAIDAAIQEDQVPSAAKLHHSWLCRKVLSTVGKFGCRAPPVTASRRAPALASSPFGSDSTPDLAAIGTHVYILAMLYIELAIIIVLILVNGFLALAELAIVSSRRARL